jgi:hypothetical protein
VQIMTKLSRHFAIALVAAVTALVAPAAAQFPPAPEPPEEPAKPPVGKPKAKPAPRPGPSVIGKWAGELMQVGSSAPYKFEIAITPQGGETKYPDLNCTGKLMKVGQSRSYVFFVEVITKGQVDKGGRCPDGTITVARAGEKLALAWFGSPQETMIVAYGTLAKK